MISISAAPIAAGSITTDKLADNAVTEAKISGGAVTENKIATQAVTNPKIGLLAVDTGQIAGSAVLTEKLPNAAVAKNKVKTYTATLAGAVGWGVNIELTSYCFFPMIHVGSPADTLMSGHSTDGASENLPRFRLEGNNSGDSYDVDYRYIG